MAGRYWALGTSFTKRKLRDNVERFARQRIILRSAAYTPVHYRAITSLPLQPLLAEPFRTSRDPSTPADDARQR